MAMACSPVHPGAPDRDGAAPPADTPQDRAARRPRWTNGDGPDADAYLFSLWAPFARNVYISGDFNDWSESDAMEPIALGHWFRREFRAEPGDRYRFIVEDASGNLLWRNDPRGQDVMHSNGDNVVPDRLAPSLPESRFDAPPRDEWIIYEMHLGTFTGRAPEQVGTFDGAIERLPYLEALGINVVQLMPVAEFAGDISWGYNPAHPFAVETAYGGAAGLRRFIDAAHAHGIAVVLDVVYNHFGPSDLSLWQFDGWHQNDLGGIYFYNDDRARTPWGHTRPDYGRPEVRDYLHDNVDLWLRDFRVDGLRWDSTVNIRLLDYGTEIPDGWRVMQQIMRAKGSAFMIAEDLANNPWITRPAEAGGAGFDAQWSAEFVHPIRNELIVAEDRYRNLHRIAAAIRQRHNDDPLQRVIYTESHDEVANGRARLPEDIWPGAADSWPARKRSTLGAVLTLTSPGIPMLFQGQEFLEDEWFRDVVPLDWSRLERFPGIHRLYQDLIALRRNLSGTTAGLLGPHVNVYHLDHTNKVLAMHRFKDGGPRDDVVVVVNLSSENFPSYRVGLPRAGTWRVRFASDNPRYGEDFGEGSARDVRAEDTPHGGLYFSGDLSLEAYSAVILSQD